LETGAAHNFEQSQICCACANGAANRWQKGGSYWKPALPAERRQQLAAGTACQEK